MTDHVFVVGPADSQPSLIMRMLEDVLTYTAHLNDDDYIVFLLEQYARTDIAGQLRSILLALYPQELDRLDQMAAKLSDLTHPSR